MAASRITFAIGDLVAEIKALVPKTEVPVVEVHLGEAEFGAVIAEIENHYSQELKRDPTFDGVGVRFGGVRIVMIAKQRAEPANA